MSSVKNSCAAFEHLQVRQMSNSKAASLKKKNLFQLPLQINDTYSLSFPPL